jgi:hypothetical protein
LSSEEVVELMSKMRGHIQQGGVSDADISRWAVEEREAQTALSGLQNPYLAEETNEARCIPQVKGRTQGFGSIPDERDNECFRGLMVQLNNISTNTTTEIKLPILCNLIRRYNPHIIGAIEVGWNWKRYKASDRLALMVSDLQRESRSYAAYNEHESEYPLADTSPE